MGEMDYVVSIVLFTGISTIIHCLISNPVHASITITMFSSLLGYGTIGAYLCEMCPYVCRCF